MQFHVEYALLLICNVKYWSLYVYMFYMQNKNHDPVIT